jgi:hypothetical protein
MAVADRHGLPVAISSESATPHEVKLAESTLVQMVIPEPPQNLIGDNANDSDKLDTRLSSYGIELISPDRSNRKNQNTGSKTSAAVSPTLENRKIVCLATELS